MSTLPPREQAALYMRSLLLTADSATQKQPGYLDRAYSVVEQLVRDGVQPGDTNWSGPVNGWMTDEGTHVLVSGDVEVHQAALKTPKSRDVEHRQRLCIRVPFAYIPTLCRHLEHVDLPLAMSLRVAFLAGELDPSDKSRRHPLAVLSAALRPEALPPSKLRNRVLQIASLIPVPPGITLQGFQQVGIVYAALSGFRCLIGDSPGVGKTAQAIGSMALGGRRTLPAAVYCPASVVINWRDEIRRFAPHLRPVIVETSTVLPPAPKPNTVYILSSGLLTRTARLMRDLGVRLVVYDESQQFKNPKAKRTKAAMALARNVPHVLLLSGTPMENRAKELWPQLHMVAPSDFPSADDFQARFATDRERTVRIRRNGQAVDRTFRDLAGGANLAALAVELRRYMIRRLKTDVRTDLPPKVRTSVWVDLPKASRAAYAKVEREMEQWIAARFRRKGAARAWDLYLDGVRQGKPSRDSMRDALREANANPPSEDAADNMLLKLGHLRRVLGQVKVAAAVQWIRGFRHKRKQPLVVFVKHQRPLKAIGRALTDLGIPWTHIDGRVKALERGKRVAAFSAGQYDVILCSQAASTGLNLQRAAHMLFVERWWVPAWEEQAEDRIHRGGQERTARIYYLMARGTVDEHIEALVSAKRVQVESVLGGETVKGRQVHGRANGRVAKGLARVVLRRVTRDLARGQSAYVTVADVKRHAKRERARQTR